VLSAILAGRAKMKRIGTSQRLANSYGDAAPRDTILYQSVLPEMTIRKRQLLKRVFDTSHF